MLYKWIKIYCLTGLLSALLFPLRADDTGKVEGRVTTTGGQSLLGVNVYIQGSNRGTATNTDGWYRLESIPAGEYVLVAEYIGRYARSRKIVVAAGATLREDFQLPPAALLLPGIVVSAGRGGATAEVLNMLGAGDIRRSPAPVTGELLREIPGVEAVRRGPVGLDPVVRGLRETEVGVYLDGTRIFPGGPGRMDSPLSHLDPSAIQKIQVVKGPYALTWGAGNLSAIRAETPELTRILDGVHAAFSTGYYSNTGATQGALSLSGKRDQLAFWLHGVARRGGDYESGTGVTIPASYYTGEIRGKLGYSPTPTQGVQIEFGYQNQQNIDYPGRLLNARYFHTRNLAGRWSWRPRGPHLKTLTAQLYYNQVDHLMDNDGKPTALPDSNRMPPFPLMVEVNAQVKVTGGRVAADLEPGKFAKLQVGADLYSAYRNAVRIISRRDTTVQLFEDLMWPGATIRDIGLYAQVEKTASANTNLTATLRLDWVQAQADTVSDFFQENASDQLAQSELNLSGALNLSRRLNEHWRLALGVGSAVRTADAKERYSDRIPASKAQTSAEFMGNPSLKPERGTQADLWLEAVYPRVSFYCSLFARRLDNYITLEPTDLPKRLPLSPATVYRYINGTAEYWGAEASGSYKFTDQLKAILKAHYLWGEDVTLGEPALGVAPASVETSMRYQSPGVLWSVEPVVRVVGRQERVATTRGESVTEGYTTIDVRARVNPLPGLEVRFGVINLTDVEYVNHLNAKNPFTGAQLPEPGRMWYVNLNYAF